MTSSQALPATLVATPGSEPSSGEIVTLDEIERPAAAKLDWIALSVVLVPVPFCAAASSSAPVTAVEPVPRSSCEFPLITGRPLWVALTASAPVVASPSETPAIYALTSPVTLLSAIARPIEKATPVLPNEIATLRGGGDHLEPGGVVGRDRDAGGGDPAAAVAVHVRAHVVGDLVLDEHAAGADADLGAPAAADRDRAGRDERVDARGLVGGDRRAPVLKMSLPAL